MKIYLVGGSVRDQLLGHPSNDKDWVVVGATPEIMEAKGFIKVGKAFPVFIDPKTQEEYALARTEKKTGAGYYGFECYFSDTVTLEEDLSRRDLTINAMALDPESQQIIDPYNGQADLHNKILRHVSAAFIEDPIRLLRVSRLLARYQHLGFTIAPETMDLMKQMVQMGEVNALIPERVWQECEKALAEPNPLAFIQNLRHTGALAVLFPELDILYGIPQPPLYHPEIDTGIHVEMVLQRIAELSTDPLLRFAALVHDLGKGATPPHLWPSHRGHEERGVPIIKALCERLKLPKAYQELGVLVSRYHLHCHRVFELRAQTVVKTLIALDAFRRPDRFEAFLLVCQADAQGRLGLENRSYDQRAYFAAAYQAARSIDIQALLEKTQCTGDDLKNRIIQARVSAVKHFITTYKTNRD